MSPYQVLFGQLPPTIPHYAKGSTSIQALEDILLELNTLLHSLKDNLCQAQHRMLRKLMRITVKLTLKWGIKC